MIEIFLNFFIYVFGDFNENEPYIKLFKFLDKSRETIYYLSTSPTFYGPIINNLKKHFVSERLTLSKIVLEKPFGSSLETAKKLNTLLYSAFREDQIYRIDHYLGKETVQNIFTFRFGNSFLKIFGIIVM